MYLITGCVGFIGFHMCKYLVKKKIKVLGIDNLNKSFKISYKPKRTGEMEITYGSNLKLLKVLKNKNFIKFIAGLKRTILWYKNYSNKSFLELFK